MDKLKCLEAFMQILDTTQRITDLAWKRLAPAAIKAYAEEIAAQAEIIIKEGEDECSD